MKYTCLETPKAIPLAFTSSAQDWPYIVFAYKIQHMVIVPYWLHQLPCKSRARRHQMTLCCVLLGCPIPSQYHKVLPEITICETKPLWVNPTQVVNRVDALTAGLLPLVSTKAAALHRSPHKNIPKLHPKPTGFSRSASACLFALNRAGAGWPSWGAHTNLLPAWAHCTSSAHTTAPGPHHPRKPCHFYADASKQGLKSPV